MLKRGESGRSMRLGIMGALAHRSVEGGGEAGELHGISPHQAQVYDRKNR